MVDGQRSIDDLTKLVPGDAEATLQQLLVDGFIDVFAVLADRPPAPAPAPTPAPAPAKSGGSIETTKRDAVRYLNDKLGPAGEGVAIKIERAKSMAELQPLLAQAAQVLHSFGGSSTSEPFITRFINSPTSG